MREVSLWQAIQLWFGGESLVTDYSMMGVSFLWWGRIGKIASIVGGLVVVLDYVGEERLRGWGSNLRDKPLRKMLAKIKSGGCLPVLIALAGIALISVRVQQMIGDRVEGLITPILTWVTPYRDRWFWVWLALTAASISLQILCEKRDARKLELAFRGTTGLLFYTFLVVLIMPHAPDLIVYGITFMIVLGLMWLLAQIADIAIVALDPLVIRPTAWALSRETPGQPIRWAGFTLLLLGQLIDLLAS